MLEEFSHRFAIMIRGAYNSLVWLPLPTDSGLASVLGSTVSLATPPLYCYYLPALPQAPYLTPSSHKVLSGL